MKTTLEHTRSCPSLNPVRDDMCTCGLEWRIRLATEQEMHAAWRKRGEESELREAKALASAEAWKRLVTGLEELLACYRVEGQPKESTFQKIADARFDISSVLAARPDEPSKPGGVE